MTDWAHRTMVISAAQAPLARTICEQLPPANSGSNMFVRELSATGDAPATHYINSGWIKPEFANLLGDSQGTYNAVTFRGITHQGAPITLAQIQAMYAASTIVADANPHEVIASLGLQFVRRAL